MGSQEARQPPPSLRLQGLSNATVPSFSSSGRCMSEPQGGQSWRKGEPGARVLGGGAGTL